MRALFYVIFITLIAMEVPSSWGTPCETSCGNIPINYPFGLDEGCGASQFKGMLNCSTDLLFFLTPSGSYRVQNIDYQKNKMLVYDPSMSTCSILQPRHGFELSDVQNAIIRPSYDTVFGLLNCSLNSLILNRYHKLCFNVSGHSCDELYGSCSAFRIFNVSSPSGNDAVQRTASCCLTSYDTVRFMKMNILDCSHYTTVIDGGNNRDVAPQDWLYGIELSYSVPELGCPRCQKSGGACGFDPETDGFLCICPASANATGCGARIPHQAGCDARSISYLTFILAIMMSFIYTIL